MIIYCRMNSLFYRIDTSRFIDNNLTQIYIKETKNML